MTVRVRVAPSPTGDPHVGTAYQALFNYAFARKNDGQFVLRIEDTDRARSRRESEELILDSLRWLGLDWDEGPDVGGPHAPYRQSERIEIYQHQAQRLLDAGHAYRDFTTKEELERIRKEQYESKQFERYERRYRDLPAEESERRSREGEPYTIRLKVPTEGECVMHDLLRGEIRREWSLIDDQVLLKSDGFPTYHLACVVDDHLMGITHVIRGEEWINSVPKHLLLYEYLGFDVPVYAHLPLLRNNDANKTKLSKRKNPTSISYFRRAGFLPQAMLNFLALMGISRPEGEEKFSLEEFVDEFELENVSLGGPVFDVEKLRWLNGRYVREDHTTEELREALKEWAINDATIDAIVPLAKPRLETLGDWGYLTAFFFTDEVELDPDDLVSDALDETAVKEMFQLAIWRFEELRAWTVENVEQVLRELGDHLDLKLRVMTRPFYVAMSGRKASTPLFDSMVILGSDMTRVRLRRAIDALGGLGGKKMKALEKRYAEMFGR